MSVRPSDIQFLKQLIYTRSAIVVDSDKDYLVEARLGPIARDVGLGSIKDLVSRLRVDADRELPTRVVEAMTTNETTFFRDVSPFEALEKAVLPSLLQSRAASKSIRIWSGACSTGQEPYSIAMLITQNMPALKDWHVRIVGSDLASTVLDRAREGKYRQLEVNRGLPARYLVSCFDREGADWRIKREIRERVEFRQQNLLQPYPPDRFDIIFLRNVLIYFDVETKRAILARLRQALAPDGYLFLGGAETTFNIDSTYRREAFGTSSFYRPGPT